MTKFHNMFDKPRFKIFRKNNKYIILKRKLETNKNKLGVEPKYKFKLKAKPKFRPKFVLKSKRDLNLKFKAKLKFRSKPRSSFKFKPRFKSKFKFKQKFKYKKKDKSKNYKFKKRKKKWPKREKPTWIAREDLYPLKKANFKVFKNSNNYGIKWWSYYYNYYYSKKYSRNRHDKRFWTGKNVFFTEMVKDNVKLMNFFSSFINKFFKKTNLYYPEINLLSRSAVRFEKFYIYFFIRKKILLFYKKFVQLVSLYLNIHLNVKIFIIGKKSVTSYFLVNYLCYGFKNKESFNYMLKPIRVVLTNMLHTKYKLKQRHFEEIREKDTIVPLIKFSKYDFLSFSSVLKVKKALLLKKLSNVFFNYKINVLSNSFRYILIKRKREYKYKHFTLQKNKFNNYNIIKNLKYSLQQRVKFNAFKTRQRLSNSIKKLVYLLKRVYFSFKYWRKRLFIKILSKIYFFTSLKHIAVRKKLRKYVLYYNISIMNINNIYKNNYVSVLSKRNKILESNIQSDNGLLLNNILYYFCMWLYSESFTYILFEKSGLNIEYEYLFGYYNEVFNYKDLTFYNKKYKNLFNFCKKCFLWTRNDCFLIIDEFTDQWKKYNFIDTYDFTLYQRAVNSFQSAWVWFKQQYRSYEKLKYFFYKQTKYPKLILPNSKNFLFENIFMQKQLIKKQINCAKSILFLFFQDNIMFLIFVKSLIQTKLKNPFVDDENFYIIYGYFYYNLVKGILIHRIKDTYELEHYTDLSLYNKSFIFKAIILNLTKKLISNNYLVNYFFRLNKYKRYLIYLNFLNDINYNQIIFDKKFIESPLMKKKTRMKFFFGKSALYGYKFHFAGRFTRKQKSANLWFQVGYMENSSMISKIDYAFKFVVLRFSVCSIKVWLYKSNNYPTYRFNVFV